MWKFNFEYLKQLIEQDPVEFDWKARVSKTQRCDYLKQAARPRIGKLCRIADAYGIEDMNVFFVKALME